MKRLLLMRHAKSSWKNPALTDYDRPLNKRGRDAARRIGEFFRRQDLAIELAVHSTARRTRETLEILLESYDAEVPVEGLKALYLASGQKLLSAVRSLPVQLGSVLIIGHNPGVQNAALTLAAGSTSKHVARIRQKFPTAAVAIFELQTGEWSRLSRKSAELADYVLPRELT